MSKGLKLGDYSKVDESKRHVMIWSGGCDSTALLDQLSEHFGTEENPINAISVNHGFWINAEKTKKEKAARKKILSVLRKRGRHVRHVEIDVKEKGDRIDTRSMGMPQACLWLPTIMPFVHPGDNVYLGYIRKDDIWHAIDSFREMVKSASTICQSTAANLVLPLEYIEKKDIIRHLKESKLYDHTWFCEGTEKGELCGWCVPCKTHASALMQLWIEGADWAKEPAESMFKRQGVNVTLERPPVEEKVEEDLSKLTLDREEVQESESA